MFRLFFGVIGGSASEVPFLLPKEPNKTIISQDGSFLPGGKPMDPRVHGVMQMLRKQALTPDRSCSDVATGESKIKQEQKVSLEEMALKFGLSESRLRALFKAQVGLPPTQYVIKMRMKNAAKELRESYERVTEIAAGLGFDSDSYFTRAFKKTYGMTPTQYRKLHQQSSREEEVENDASSGR